MTKKDKFNPNNVLGWTEKDFIEMKLELANAKMGNSEKLTPKLNSVWCNYAQEFFWGDDNNENTTRN